MEIRAGPQQSVTKAAVKYWAIIADNLRKAGWRCGCISSTDHEGRQFWVVAAEREDAGRFIVHTDKMPTAFLELQASIVDLNCDGALGDRTPSRPKDCDHALHRMGNGVRDKY